MNRTRWMMAAFAAAAFGTAAWAVFATGNTGDVPRPPRQAAPQDDLARFAGYSADGHPGHVCEPADHHAGYTYTPHRYPRVAGGEVSAIIHRGFSPMRVPKGTPDEQWITAPPSEVMF